MVRLRKGELDFYKKLFPHELEKYVRDHPVNTEYVKHFLQRYKFNYVRNKWIKLRKKREL